MKIQTFDYNVNVSRALLWQYNEAVNITKLVFYKQIWLLNNQNDFWESWYKNVFNLITADLFGLSVWSIILNIPLFVESEITNKIAWGFGPFRKNFNRGNFQPSQGSISLTLEEQRIILRLRYFQFCNRTDAIDVNRFIKEVFKSLGRVYMLDGLNMQISYVFQFTPSTSLLLALKQYDLMPRAAGVKINYIFGSRETWGFGPFRKNFNRGTFNSVS